MISGAYRIVLVRTSECYIGSSLDIYRRWNQSRCALRGGYHTNVNLQSAWFAQGESSFAFEILEVVQGGSRYELEIKAKGAEQRWIDSLRPAFNVARDAIAPFRGRRHSTATKERIARVIKSSWKEFHTR